MSRCFIRLLFILFLTPWAAAVELRPLVVTDSDQQAAWSALFFLADPDERLSLNEVKRSIDFSHLGPTQSGIHLRLADASPLLWQRWGKRDIPSFGYQSGSQWALLPLRNETNSTQSRIISISAPILDEVDIFVFTRDAAERHYRSGNLIPPKQRVTQTTVPSGIIVLPPQSNALVLFRTRSETALHWPVKLTQSREFSSQQRADLALEMLFYGLILALVISQFTHYIINHRQFTLWYGFAGMSILAFFASISGVGTLYIWGEWGIFARDVIVYTLIMMFIATCGLGIQVMNIKDNLPKLNILLRVLQYLALIWLLLLVVLGYSIAIISLMIYSAVVCLGFVALGGFLWRHRSREGKFYVISWAPFFVTGAIFMLSKIGLTYWEPVIARLMQMAAVFQLLVYFYYQSSTFAQQSEALLKSREEALVLEKNYSAKLEQEVDDQTRALNIANQQLQQMNMIDALSGAYNRTYFNQEYPKEVKRALRHQSHLSLLLIDIDSIQNINEHFGHMAGDKAIRTLSEMISQVAQRETDWLARFNADRFVVVLPDTPLTHADDLAEKIMARLDSVALRNEDNLEYSFTMSIGVSSDRPQDDRDPFYLLDNAEQALRHAKQRGTGRIWVYEQPS
ncbi:MAG: GGDEF domain-containing protein [Gammaproteobacteria bacterium]|nr:GGDEF domain-containing protein [Gammaproteobacteria bacterium]